MSKIEALRHWGASGSAQESQGFPYSNQFLARKRYVIPVDAGFRQAASGRPSSVLATPSRQCHIDALFAD